jgi:hypothetical protein
VHPYPRLPPLEETTAAADGHLWLREYVVGAGLRFSLVDGVLAFGDHRREFDGEAPLGLRAAVRHVRERFDREALRAAVDDPARVTLFGVAPRHQGIPYDWAHTPAFLGTEVYDGAAGRRLPVDAATRAFERLGLRPVNAVEKEVSARDFHPDRYEVPPSEWYPGPAAGVVVRNRNGKRGLLAHPAYDPGDRPPAFEDAAAAAEALVTPERCERVVESLTDAGRPASPEAVVERVLESVAREAYARLYRDGESVIDERAVRGAVAERTRRWLDG